MNLHDLLDYKELDEMITERYVRAAHHPSESLTILNYTQKAVFDNVWNDVTLTCRGLIYKTDTREVVARPFKKFFNWGQEGCPQVSLDEAVEVSDKLDGSLGILYRTSRGPMIATRGSFISSQAAHASRVLRERYSHFEPWDDVTYLFEIVYPENRVVVNYGDTDDLFLLDAIDIESGDCLLGRLEGMNMCHWPGSVVETFRYDTFEEVLAAEPRENSEGFVVYFPYLDERVKIKQEDYLELHRIVTGLSARRVWEWLMERKPLGEFLEPIPDEFQEWVRDVADELILGVEKEVLRLQRKYFLIREEIGNTDRKTFALRVKDDEDSWAMFALLDSKDLRPELWKRGFMTPPAEEKP